MFYIIKYTLCVSSQNAEKVSCHISFELNGCQLNIHSIQEGTLLLENVYILKNIQLVHK